MPREGPRATVAPAPLLVFLTTATAGGRFVALLVLFAEGVARFTEVAGLSARPLAVEIFVGFLDAVRKFSGCVESIRGCPDFCVRGAGCRTYPCSCSLVVNVLALQGQGHVIHMSGQLGG